jgi:hypothetical protein
MGSLKDNLKYTPPDFRLFEDWVAKSKVGFRGAYLFEARLGISQMLDAYAEAISKRQNGRFLEWPNMVRGYSEYDLVDLYAGWAKADDMLFRLESMPADERKKHLELDKKKHDLDYQEVEDLHSEYAGTIAVFELICGSEYEPVLDGLLKRRLKDWEEFLEDVSKHGFGRLGGEPMDQPSEFCDERTTLEYAGDGIGAMRMKGYATEPRKQRLQGLPFLPTYKKSLEATDKKFRETLQREKNSREQCYEPWADPFFWWHYPPNPKKK